MSKCFWFKDFKNLVKFSSGAANVIYRFEHDSLSYVIKVNISGNESFENEFKVLTYLRKKRFLFSPKAISEGKFLGHHYMVQECR